MPLQNLQGQARTSCSRCQKRKKRCDRTLPQCGNCRRAIVTCSFMDDHGQTASYPIGYVRSLERRIHDLEACLANSNGEPSQFANDASFALHDGAMFESAGDGDDAVFGEESVGSLSYLLRAQHNNNTAGGADSSPMLPHALDDELRQMLSEGTAEYRLGPTSGIAFASFTQSTLGRLAIDKSDQPLEDTVEQDDLGELTFHSPLDLLNPSIFSHTEVPKPCDVGSTPGFGMSSATELTDYATNLDSRLDMQHVNRLVEVYFAHSHILYPVIDRREFMSSLDTLQEESRNAPPQSPMCLFRIWMVLTIGSAAYCSVDMSAAQEHTKYYNKALRHSNAAAALNNMAAIEVIILRVTYSLFNQLEANTWLLVGVAVRIALGMGLQSTATYQGLPFDMVERRKRLFFSLYMMDRVISTTLGRPFAIDDDDIEVSPFVVTNDEEAHIGEADGQKSLDLSSMAIPLHILKLRRISSRIQTWLYTNSRDDDKTDDEKDDIIHGIHKELIQWRRDMPFPLPKIDAPVPHFTSTWYDFNYHTHLAILYRPTPMLPTLDERRMKILTDAASSSIRLASSMYRQGIFSHHWLNLHAVYMSTVALVYVIAVQLDDSAKQLVRTKAAEDVQLALQLFESMGLRYPAARRAKALFGGILRRYQEVG